MNRTIIRPNGDIHIPLGYGKSEILKINSKASLKPDNKKMCDPVAAEASGQGTLPDGDCGYENCPAWEVK